MRTPATLPARSPAWEATYPGTASAARQVRAALRPVLI
jgi:hypothetical protein